MSSHKESSSSRHRSTGRSSHSGSSRIPSSTAMPISDSHNRASQRVYPTSSSSPPVYKRVKVQDLLNDDDSYVSRSANQAQASSSADGIPNIVCEMDQCGRKFATFESLTAHQKRQHAAPTAFVCPYCHSSYSSLPNLNKHVSISSYGSF